MSKPFQIDEDRKRRLGFEEVVFGAAKSVELLTGLLKEYQQKKQNVLVTKLQQDKAAILQPAFPGSFYDRDSEVFTLAAIPLEEKDPLVGIITAGSSDVGVAKEAYFTLQYMGVRTCIVPDIGVAGLHRLLEKLSYLQQFKVLIVIAGFEGALPTVIGGLLPQPIIAVPTSIGYGTAKAGETALHAMLTSCANGIAVVNIDNGYGAAMTAFRIINPERK